VFDLESLSPTSTTTSLKQSKIEQSHHGDFLVILRLFTFTSEKVYILCNFVILLYSFMIKIKIFFVFCFDTENIF